MTTAATPADPADSRRPATTTAGLECNLCHGREVTVLSGRSRSGKPLRTVCCTGCGLVWSDPRPHDARRFYEDEYRLDYKQTFEPRPRHVLRAGRVALDRAAKIRDLLARPRRALDIGSGGGEFAYLLATLGHDVHGVEPNRGYAQYAAREYGLDIQRGFVDEAELPEAGFDLVTIWHVLEHTEDPHAVLRRLRRALRPDGVLVVEVPNVEATCQSPRSSFHEAHLYTFSPLTLEALARRAGLALRSCVLSDDGGNVTATFVRAAEPVPPGGSTGAPDGASADPSAAGTPAIGIPGHHARIAGIVARHTTWRHLLSAHPYRRLAGRVARALDERRALPRQASGRQILDALYAPCVGRLAPPVAARPPARQSVRRPLRLWPAALGAVALAVLAEETIVDRTVALAPATDVGALGVYVALQAAVIVALLGYVRRGAGGRSAYLKVAGLSVPLALIPVYC